MSQLFLYVTPEQPAFDIKTLPANILIGIGTAIGVQYRWLDNPVCKIINKKNEKTSEVG